jgi:hypothetical protein
MGQEYKTALGHQGIPGNEEADRLAKEGAVEVPRNQFAAIPFSVGKNFIKKQLEQRHWARRTACTGHQQSKVLMRHPLPSRTNEVLAMNKLRLRAAVELLTGHTSLRAHLHKLGHTERPESRLCGYEKEDTCCYLGTALLFTCNKSFLRNAQVVYYPPDCTSVVQPLE